MSCPQPLDAWLLAASTCAHYIHPLLEEALAQRFIAGTAKDTAALAQATARANTLVSFATWALARYECGILGNHHRELPVALFNLVPLNISRYMCARHAAEMVSATGIPTPPPTPQQPSTPAPVEAPLQPTVNTSRPSYAAIASKAVPPTKPAPSTTPEVRVGDHDDDILVFVDWHGLSADPLVHLHHASASAPDTLLFDLIRRLRAPEFRNGLTISVPVLMRRRDLAAVAVSAMEAPDPIVTIRLPNSITIGNMDHLISGTLPSLHAAMSRHPVHYDCWWCIPTLLGGVAYIFNTGRQDDSPLNVPAHLFREQISYPPACSAWLSDKHSTVDADFRAVVWHVASQAFQLPRRRSRPIRHKSKFSKRYTAIVQDILRGRLLVDPAHFQGMAQDYVDALFIDQTCA